MQVMQKSVRSSSGANHISMSLRLAYRYPVRLPPLTNGISFLLVHQLERFKHCQCKRSLESKIVTKNAQAFLKNNLSEVNLMI
jgi:hypothetical protein